MTDVPAGAARAAGACILRPLLWVTSGASARRARVRARREPVIDTPAIASLPPRARRPVPLSPRRATRAGDEIQQTSLGTAQVAGRREVDDAHGVSGWSGAWPRRRRPSSRPAP